MRKDQFNGKLESDSRLTSASEDFEAVAAWSKPISIPEGFNPTVPEDCHPLVCDKLTSIPEDFYKPIVESGSTLNELT